MSSPSPPPILVYCTTKDGDSFLRKRHSSGDTLKLNVKTLLTRSGSLLHSHTHKNIHTYIRTSVSKVSQSFN